LKSHISGIDFKSPVGAPGRGMIGGMGTVDGRVRGLGLVLAATAALPLAPDGRSFLHFVAAAFSADPLSGLLTLVGLGSPFLFGLAVLLATRLSDPVASRVLRWPIAMMHSQLVLVSWAVWRGGDAVAAFPMFGFALTSAIYFLWISGRARAEGEGLGPSPGWLVRWGATIVAAICMWARIQMFGPIKLGVAIDAAWLCAAGMVLLLRRAR
jgi:hypothetical protein